MSEVANRDTLSAGYNLMWYELRSVLGRGGYGITYLALDKNLDRLVAIKEYLPTEFAARESDSTVQPMTGEQADFYEWGLRRFLKEARILAKFNHRNVVRVLSVFEANNTAYMVMEYEKGEPLSQVYQRHGKLNEQHILNIFLPILEGLSLIHKSGFIHRDIKPSNIYIREDQSPVLIDFGSARQATGGATKALTSLVTYGFAPFEQYNESEDKQGPWTDIYALGASVYLAIVGELPPEALARGSTLLNDSIDPYQPVIEKLAGQYSASFLTAVDHALQFRPQDRPQDVLSWADMLLGKREVDPLTQTIPNAQEYLANSGDETLILPKSRQARPGGNSNRPNATQQARRAGTSGTQQARSSGASARRPATMDPRMQLTGDYDSLSGISPGVSSYSRRRKSKPKSGSGLLLISIVSVVFAIGSIVWYKIGGSKSGITSFDQITASNNAETPAKAATGTSSLKKPEDRSAANDKPSASSKTKPQQVIQTDEPKPAKPEPSKVEVLLTQAQKDLQQGKRLEPANDNAGYRFLEVLKLEPDNEKAKNGIVQIIAYYSTIIRKHIAEGDASKAKSIMQPLVAMFPKQNDVQSLQKLLDQQEQDRDRVKQLLASAATDIQAGRIVAPSGNNAYEKYKEVLKVNPGDKEAAEGIQKITGYFVNLTNQFIRNEEFEEAEKQIAYIDQVAPGSAAAKNLRDKLRTKQEQRKYVVSLLERAKANFEAKKMISPKGDNALEGYRQVIQIDPMNRAARDGIADINRHYKTEFDKQMAAGNYEDAAGFARAIEYIGPDTELARNVRETLNNSIQKSETDIKSVSQVMSSYKTAFESGDTDQLVKLSIFRPGSREFMNQFFAKYQDSRLQVEGFKYIRSERKGAAKANITNLKNKQGNAVTPGAWSKFDIEIRQNSDGDWKVIW